MEQLVPVLVLITYVILSVQFTFSVAGSKVLSTWNNVYIIWEKKHTKSTQNVPQVVVFRAL